MRRIRLLLIPLLALLLIIPLAVPAQTGKGDRGKAPAATAKTQDLIDINTASEDQLRSIPGIGDAYAAKIVKGRPYRAKNEMVDRKILPQGVYLKVKDRIIARQK